MIESKETTPETLTVLFDELEQGCLMAILKH